MSNSVNDSWAGRPVGKLPVALLGVALLLGGCAGAEVDGGGNDGMGVLDTEIGPDQIVERFDLDGDGKADVWKVYKRLNDGEEGASEDRVLVRKDMDINFDGRVDIRKHYAPNGEITKEEMDLDFDGRVDAVSHYREGKLHLREMDMAFDGTTDLWKYYENDQLIRKERDANHDGKPDYWEFYQDGKLVRTGRDLDGDGKPESYEDVVPEG